MPTTKFGCYKIVNPTILNLLGRKRMTFFGELKSQVRSAGRGDKRQIPVGLLGRAQTVTNQKGFVDQEAEVVRLQLHPARGLPVQKRGDFDRGGASRF